jgi:hypothetical protein
MKKDKDLKVMTYRGVDVLIDSGFRFFAHHNGMYYTGGSWETLRKKLDKAVVFEPFDALQLGRDGVQQVRITAVDVDDSQWVVERDGQTHGGTRVKFYHALYPVAMREELETYLANCEEWEIQETAIKEARETEQAAIDAKRLPRPDESP